MADVQGAGFLVSKFLQDLLEDTTPQLGGDLDVNGNAIVSTSNGDIEITPDGTGNVVLDGLNWPQADGSSNQYLKTNGAGQLSWGTPSGGLSTTTQVISSTGFTLTHGDNDTIFLSTTGSGTYQASAIADGSTHGQRLLVRVIAGDMAVATQLQFLDASLSGDLNGDWIVSPSASYDRWWQLEWNNDDSTWVEIGRGNNANEADGEWSFAGGLGNSADGTYSFVYGDANIDSGASTNVLFGSANTTAASSYNNFVAGNANDVSSYWQAVFGDGNTVAGEANVVGGRFHTLNNINSACFGSANYGEAEADYSLMTGRQAWAQLPCTRVMGAGTAAGVSGDTQGVDLLLNASTTSTTPAVMAIDFNTSNVRSDLPPNTVWTYVGTLSAYSTSGNCRGWQVNGIIEFDGTTTTLVASNQTSIGDTSSGNLTVTVAADDTNDALKFTVTGEATYNCNWCLYIRIAQALLPGASGTGGSSGS